MNKRFIHSLTKPDMKLNKNSLDGLSYKVILTTFKWGYFFILIMLFVSATSYSQTYISKDNTPAALNWSTSTSWTGGVAPGYSISTSSVINGYIVSSSSITLQSGLMTIKDTLVIYGSLTIQNNADLTLEDGSILIVYGNLNINNKVNISANSYLIVGGNVSESGSKSEIISNDSPSKIFVGGTVESSMTGDNTSYPALYCGTDAVPNYEYNNCNYGNFGDLQNTPISDFVNGLSCTSTPSIYGKTTNSPVVVGATITLSVNTNANAIYWKGPGGWTATSTSNIQVTRTMATTSMSGYYIYTAVNTSTGCTKKDSIYVQVMSNSCCIGSAYFSKDNYTGQWTDANSWGNANETWNPNPPSATGTGSGASNSMCINGTITKTGDLTLTGGTKTICDTLIITGNLNATSTTLNITATGVLIVLGNFTGGSGNLSDNGKLIVAGNANIPYSFSYNGSGTSYLFNPVTIQGFTPTGTTLTSLQSNDPSLYNTYMSILCGSGISGGTIGINRTLCSGDNVPAFNSVSDASPAGGITYQWYMSTNSSNPASGTWSQISGISTNIYDHGAVTQTTYFYRKATKGGGCSANSNVLTVTVNPAPSVTNQTAAICSVNAFTVTPAGVPVGTTYTWTAPTISPAGAISGSAAQASGQSSISQTLVNATSNNATATYTVTPTSGTCIGNTFSVTITVYPKPAFTLGTLPSVCVGETAFNIPYTSPTGIPATYSVLNGIPAVSGFSPVTDATLSGSPISVPIPGTLTVGDYQLSLSLKNANGCISNNYLLGLKIIPKPDTGEFYRKPNN